MKTSIWDSSHHRRDEVQRLKVIVKEARIRGQQRIGLFNGVGADQKIGGYALARPLVARLAAHDAGGAKRCLHRQRVVFNLAGQQKFAQILLIRKIPPKLRHNHRANTQTAMGQRLRSSATFFSISSRPSTTRICCLAPGLRPSSSRISFGITIWPRSAKVTSLASMVYSFCLKNEYALIGMNFQVRKLIPQINAGVTPGLISRMVRKGNRRCRCTGCIELSHFFNHTTPHAQTP